jgi:hypothetical protein
MKRMLLTCTIAVFCLCFAGAAFAGTQDNARVAVHLKDFQALKVCTKNAPVNLSCRDYNTGPGQLGVYQHVYVVVGFGDPANGRGIAGVELGVLYDNASVGWTLCGDLQFTNSGPDGEWPLSTGGNRITWAVDAPGDPDDNCQTNVVDPTGVQAIAGAFYVYAYTDQLFQITPNNNLVEGPLLSVADCNAAASALSPLAAGNITFGGTEPGYNPCLEPVPVRSTTWGKVKTLFNDN